MSDDGREPKRKNRRTALILGAVALGWFLLDIIWHTVHPYR